MGQWWQSFLARGWSKESGNADIPAHMNPVQYSMAMRNFGLSQEHARSLAGIDGDDGRAARKIGRHEEAKTKDMLHDVASRARQFEQGDSLLNETRFGEAESAAAMDISKRLNEDPSTAMVSLSDEGPDYHYSKYRKG